QRRMHIPFGENLVLLTAVLLETYEHDPGLIEQRILQLDKKTSWSISYWKNNECLYHCNEEHLSARNSKSFSRLISNRRPQAIHRPKSGPLLMGYLSTAAPEKGLIMVSLNNFPPPPPRTKNLVLTGIFITL